MNAQCAQSQVYVSPFSVRRFNRDLRPQLHSPLQHVQRILFSPQNVKALTARAVAIADQKGLVSSRVAEIDIRKSMERAFVEYQGSLATEFKEKFDQRVALGLSGGATRQSQIRNKEAELSILNKRTLKHVRMKIHEKLMLEKRARQLKVGVYSQAGLMSRPHRMAPRSTNVGRQGRRDLDAGGRDSSGLASLANTT